MKRRRTARRQGDAVVNMTPMIDMVFILLIFFIVTTSFLRETAVTIERPRSRAAAPVAGPYLLVALAADGSAHLPGGPIPIDDAAAIGAALRDSGAERVVIQADAAAATGRLLRLMDSCRASGAQAVDVAARPRGTP
ncbi:MAG: ExbD/TolR family protein [Planctomycetota bacterium]